MCYNLHPGRFSSVPAKREPTEASLGPSLTTLILYFRRWERKHLIEGARDEAPGAADN